jgi:hypothetical protein
MLRAPLIFLAAVLSTVPGASIMARDPGDLFPDVDYKKTVSKPVNNPGAARANPKPKPPATTQPQQVAGTRPATASNGSATQVAATKPVEPATHSPTREELAALPLEDRNIGYRIWAPYRVHLTKSFLTDKEQAEFDKEYAEPIKKAIAANNEDRAIAITALTEAVAGRKDNLQRYVLLNVVGLSIKNNEPLEERAKRAMTVLPTLTEQTLEVVDARADCLWNLGMSAPAKANDTLWGMLVESQAMLAKLQIQSGFHKEAVESLQKARSIQARMRDKLAFKSEMLVEASQWVDYSYLLASKLPQIRAVLAANSEDAEANTSIAIAYLILHGDLQSAQTYGSRSSYDSMNLLAVVLDETRFPNISADPAHIVGDSVKIGSAVLEVAKELPGQLGKHSLAKMVVDRLDMLKAEFPKYWKNEAARLRDEAHRVMTTSAFKPIPKN